MQPESVLILSGAGLVIGSFASMVGIGGGLLWAPFFILFWKIDPYRAILFSFLIQSVGMGSATITNIRKGLIYWRLSSGLIVPVFCGVLLGAYLNSRIADPVLLERGLGFLSIAVSIYFASRTEYYRAAFNENRNVGPTHRIRFMSAISGAVSGMFSIGIGDFLIPLFRGKLKIPMSNAIATALFLNFSVALFGSLFHLVLSREPFSSDIALFLLPAWGGVLVGGQFGPRLSTIIDDARLKEIFIFLLLILGIHLIYQSM